MICITHDKPLYSSYQSNVEYIKHLKIIDRIFLNINSHKITIPLEKRFIKSTKNFDLVTPINFQTSLSTKFWEEELKNIYEALKKEDAVSCYIQTKDNFDLENEELINSERSITNYFFNLQLSEEELLRNKSKSSRLRLKKVLKTLEYELVENHVSEEFFRAYTHISSNRMFSDKYLFSYEQFLNYTKVENIKYFELRSEGEFVSGGFFGVNGVEVDYLYGAGNSEHPDSIRLLIWEAVKYFKYAGKEKLFLGGGISQNDSLADFKKRLGTNEQECRTIMMVLDKNKAEVLAQEKVTKEWYKSFFPPYIKSRA